jgi:hypothetical protein
MRNARRPLHGYVQRGFRFVWPLRCWRSRPSGYDLDPEALVVSRRVDAELSSEVRPDATREVVSDGPRRWRED